MVNTSNESAFATEDWRVCEYHIELGNGGIYDITEPLISFAGYNWVSDFLTELTLADT